MDVATMFTMIGDYGYEDQGTNTKLRAIQGAVWEIERLRPWPFLEKRVALTFAGGAGNTAPSNLPTDYRAALKAIDLVNGTRLPPLRRDDALEVAGKALSTETGDPRFYYHEALRPKFWPAPPSSTTVQLDYLAWSAALSSGSPESAFLIPKEFHEVVVFAALERIATMEDDQEIAARMEGHYKNGLVEMMESCFQHQYDAPDYIHLLDTNDWEFDY